jgi:hypothetical protein
LPYAAVEAIEPVVHGSRRVLINTVSIHNKGPILTGDRMLVEVDWIVTSPVNSVVLGFIVRDFVGRIIYGTNSELLNITLTASEDGPRKSFLAFDACFEPGSYHLDIALHASSAKSAEIYHWRERVLTFEVQPSKYWTHEGFIDAHASIEDATGISEQLIGKPGLFRLWIESVPAALPIRQRVTIPVQLFNGADYPLATFGERPFHLSYRWLRHPSGEIHEDEGLRTPLLPAHRGRTLRCWDLDVATPDDPGTYRLKIFIVQESVRWIDAPELCIDRDYLFEITRSDVS